MKVLHTCFAAVALIGIGVVTEVYRSSISESRLYESRLDATGRLDATFIPEKAALYSVNLIQPTCKHESSMAVDYCVAVTTRDGRRNECGQLPSACGHIGVHTFQARSSEKVSLSATITPRSSDIQVAVQLHPEEWMGLYILGRALVFIGLILGLYALIRATLDWRRGNV